MLSLAPERRQFIEQVLRSPQFKGEDFILENDDQYRLALHHVEEHKYLLNEKIPYEISLEQAVSSWHKNVYEPLSQAMDKYRLIKAFPGLPRGSLFLKVCAHWHNLKSSEGPSVSVEKAVCDFGARYAKNPLNRLMFKLKLGI